MCSLFGVLQRNSPEKCGRIITHPHGEMPSWCFRPVPDICVGIQTQNRACRKRSRDYVFALLGLNIRLTRERLEMSKSDRSENFYTNTRFNIMIQKNNIETVATWWRWEKKWNFGKSKPDFSIAVVHWFIDWRERNIGINIFTSLL